MRTTSTHDQHTRRTHHTHRLANTMLRKLQSFSRCSQQAGCSSSSSSSSLFTAHHFSSPAPPAPQPLGAVAAAMSPSAAAAAAAVMNTADHTLCKARTLCNCFSWPAQQQQRWHSKQQQRCHCAPADAAAGAASEAGDNSNSNIYDRPQLYDDAFSYRDFVTEAKFLMSAFQRHAQPGGKLQSVLELGCGPANHSIQLAKRGVKAWALDNNANMLAHAAKKAAAAGASSLQTVQGDMTQFSIKGMEGKLDMVVCLLGTLSHMLDNKQAAAVFSQAAKHLRPGGLLLLELAHPGDLFDGSLLLQDVGAELWEVERKAGAGQNLTVMWGTDVDDFDPVTQILYRTVSIHEKEEGADSSGEGDGLGRCVLEEVVPYRQFTAQEIDLLGMMSGLEVVEMYGDLDLDIDLTHEDAYRLVVCLRKPGAA